jgi:hypothetical protein
MNPDQISFLAGNIAVGLLQTGKTQLDDETLVDRSVTLANSIVRRVAEQTTTRTSTAKG